MRMADGRIRKALTPLLTASTPVIAVQPLAKRRISSHNPTISRRLRHRRRWYGPDADDRRQGAD